ncbi:single-stranded DNA-binding protein [Oceanispirochaeta sp.]|jgi:single-strand DNA-binding protein|uniref:single-stranded DNA-binding protein n=1 Tax=Oceanispirochaeta sp. TaxID=2035350 RepID=UPI0026128CF1|nr:single-stranded DNA-binding protein [Oceanispirochaeta sp.]MDA3956626.1 single-stranded DNA-binding protein [Oceanispirochaeta sp.]
MAEDLNRVILVGRLTRDAELQYTNTGWAICKMGLAVNRRRKQGDQWVDEANFFDVTLFGKRAESLNQYLSKGTQLAVEGHLRQERWEQDGNKRSKVTIEATNIQLLGSKNDRGQTGDSSHQGNQQGTSTPRNSQPFESYSKPEKSSGGGQADRFEDDIPF